MKGGALYILAMLAILAWGLSGKGLAAPPTPSVSSPAASPGRTVTSGPGAQQPRTDIHDIRHPVQVGINPALYYWLAGVAGALLVLLGLIFLIRKWRARWSGPAPEIAATVYEAPEEEARRGLAELAAATGLAPADYYFQLSALFRRYLQRRFSVDAPEMTTEELLPRLVGLQLDKALFSDIKSFLLFADQVKFARAGCDSGTMAQHRQLVESLVDRTAAPEAAVDNND